MTKMIIVRSDERDGTLAPSAVNFLGEIPNEYLHLNQHARRHPLAIYNVSIGQLIDDFSHLLEAYSETTKFVREHSHDIISQNGYYDQLLEAQKRLIYSLRAHIDDCYLILASLVDPANVPANAAKKIFTDKWLEFIKFLSLDSLNQSISIYKKDYLSPLVNGLKHKQSRLRCFFFYKFADVRLGYYLEEPDKDGVPGPAISVHPDENSAFSFARDILFNLYHVYYISEVLVEAVKEALQKLHSFTLRSQRVNTEDVKWRAVVQQASKIRSLIFPNEIDKPFACLSVTGDGSKQSLVFRYPVMILAPQFPPGMKMHGPIAADGVTRSFRLPYIKMSKYGGAR